VGSKVDPVMEILENSGSLGSLKHFETVSACDEIPVAHESFIVRNIVFLYEEPDLRTVSKPEINGVA